MEQPGTQQLAGGHHVQEYEIISELGAGAFGRTYLVRDTALAIRVALKEYFPDRLARRTPSGEVLCSNPEMAQAFTEGRERFIFEARVAAQFNHPNIVNILRYFRENGTAYIAMRYEPGNDLASLMKRPGFVPVSQKTLINILRDILSGLRELHDNGCVHRDIKPSNIYIREDGTPMLLDLGGAQQTGVSELGRFVVVTPRFAPVEQYLGQEATCASDLYSLGATLYRCITNSPMPSSIERHEAVEKGECDPYELLINRALPGFDHEFLSLVDELVGLYRHQRPQSADAVQEKLLALQRKSQPRIETPPIKETITLFGDKGMTDQWFRTLQSIAVELPPGLEHSPNEETLELLDAVDNGGGDGAATPGTKTVDQLELTFHADTLLDWNARLHIQRSASGLPQEALFDSSGSLLWIISSWDATTNKQLQSCLDTLDDPQRQGLNLLLAATSDNLELVVEKALMESNTPTRFNKPLLMALDVHEQDDVLCFVRSALALREAKVLNG